MLTEILLEISNRKLDNLVIIVKSISLDKGLNVKLEESPADGNQNHIAVPRNQTVRPIY